MGGHHLLNNVRVITRDSVVTALLEPCRLYPEWALLHLLHAYSRNPVMMICTSGEYSNRKRSIILCLQKHYSLMVSWLRCIQWITEGPESLAKLELCRLRESEKTTFSNIEMIVAQPDSKCMIVEKDDESILKPASNACTDVSIEIFLKLFSHGQLTVMRIWNGQEIKLPSFWTDAVKFMASHESQQSVCASQNSFCKTGL